MNLKPFVIFFLVFAWFNQANAQYDFSAKEKERITNAKVKTQTQWTYDYVDGKPSAKGYKSAVTKYDAKGNITEVINYDKDGKILLIDIHQYDSRDNKVNFERYKGNREKLQNSQKTAYDARNKKTREQGFDGASVYSNTFAYDANDRLSEINYTMDNVVVEKRAFIYTGNKTEIMIFDSKNNLTYKQENTYNDKGLLVSEIKTGGKGNVLHTLNLQYNNVGGLMEELKMRAGEQLDYQKLYRYNNENLPVMEETVSPDGTKFVSRECQYNSRGDLISDIWKKTEKAKESSSKKITYDAKGLCSEEDYYYASYQLKSLYKYTYEFY
jgi:hypothetical protein